MDARSTLGAWTGNRLFTVFFIVLAAMSLAGCGGGPGSPASSFFGGSSGGLFGGPKTMAIAPIIGAPSKISTEMSQALVQAGQAHGLNLVPNGEKAPRTIRGYLVATKQRHGSSISYIWDVTDSSGKRINRIAGEQDVSRRTSDPWSGVSASDINQIAEKTAAALAGEKPNLSVAAAPAASATTTASAPAPAPETSSSGGIGGFFSRTFGLGSSSETPTPAAPEVAAAPASTGPVYTYVAPVSGAPGDGRTSLTDALRKHLAASGAKLASSSGRNVYSVRGRVSLRDAGAGKQTIRIDWRVSDPKGKRLGTVTQQNTIAKGSLSGHWGPVANAAAGAATDGILKLIPPAHG